MSERGTAWQEELTRALSDGCATRERARAWIATMGLGDANKARIAVEAEYLEAVAVLAATAASLGNLPEDLGGRFSTAISPSTKAATTRSYLPGSRSTAMRCGRWKRMGMPMPWPGPSRSSAGSSAWT